MLHNHCGPVNYPSFLPTNQPSIKERKLFRDLKNQPLKRVWVLCPSCAWRGPFLSVCLLHASISPSLINAFFNCQFSLFCLWCLRFLLSYLSCLRFFLMTFNYLTGRESNPDQDHRTVAVEGDNWLLQLVLRPPYTRSSICMHTHSTETQ